MNCLNKFNSYLLRSGEHFFYLIKKSLFVFIRVRFEVLGIIQFFQQCFFFRGKMLGSPDIYMDQLVSFFIRVYSRKPLSFQSENFSALRAWWDFDLGPSINCRDFYLCTKYGICK